MDELLGLESASVGSEPFFLATIGSVSASGATLRINATSPTQTTFKHVETGQSLTAGDMVLVARVGGGYVVIGKIAY